MDDMSNLRDGYEYTLDKWESYILGWLNHPSVAEHRLGLLCRTQALWVGMTLNTPEKAARYASSIAKLLRGNEVKCVRIPDYYWELEYDIHLDSRGGMPVIVITPFLKAFADELIRLVPDVIITDPPDDWDESLYEYCEEEV